MIFLMNMIKKFLLELLECVLHQVFYIQTLGAGNAGWKTESLNAATDTNPEIRNTNLSSNSKISYSHPGFRNIQGCREKVLGSSPECMDSFNQIFNIIESGVKLLTLL